MQGSCLCGAVCYEVEPPVKVFQYCHCSRCRKFTGSAFAANAFVRPEQFKWIKGEELARHFEYPDAKYFATCFCSVCGSSLPWLVQGGGNVVIPAGTLDDDIALLPQRNIHWASRAPWHVSTSELDTYDELPPRKK